MMEDTGKIPNAWSTSGSILGEGKGREERDGTGGGKGLNPH